MGLCRAEEVSATVRPFAFGRFPLAWVGLYSKATRAHLRHTRVALATKPCSKELQTRTARKSLPQGVTIPNVKGRAYSRPKTPSISLLYTYPLIIISDSNKIHSRLRHQNIKVRCFNTPHLQYSSLHIKDCISGAEISLFRIESKS